MPLSRAEIQRRYRERKKTEGGDFLQKDRERKRKAYVPVSLLDESAVKKRRTETLKRVKRHYKKKKEQSLTDDSQEIPTTRRKSKGKSNLTVALEFRKKPQESKLKNLMKEVSQLTLRNEKLERTKKTLQKKLQRMSKDNPSTIETGTLSPRPTLTPRSKTDREMRNDKLSPRKHMSIRKRLLFLNVLEKNVTEKQIEMKFVGLKIANKYKQVKAFGKVVGKDRRCLARKKQIKAVTAIRAKVIEFYEREDNATTLPGKKDTVTKAKLQKKILTDYLYNLHSKFLLENPDAKISRSSFSSMRPAHILPVNFSSRNTCLCSRHQNISLKLKAVYDTFTTKNPDEFIKRYDDRAIEEKMKGIERNDVIFTEWKKQEENGKMRWKQIQTTMTKGEFVAMFMKDIASFRQHVERVKTQYAQMKVLRDNLEEGHVLVWMDFAENFTCTALDEVQSAYWTSNQVTLHTTVVYFPKSQDKSHQSFVGVSDMNIHNAQMVIAMITELISLLKAEYPEIKTVHYLSDSPTSQYRNKTIFKFISEHSALFGLKARWDYLEAGHGKGPCDGLGGSVKRSADMAIKQSKAVIQNGIDFFAWAQSQSETSVKYYYVSNTQYESATEIVNKLKDGVKAIPGTFKIHAVAPVDRNKLASREVSCNCRYCLESPENSPCAGWIVHELKTLENTGNNPEFTNQLVIDEGDFCAAIFEGEWYIGQVTTKYMDRMKVNFMEESGKLGDSFKWPSKKDEVYIPITDILMKIPRPIPSGKSKRMYKLGLEIIDMIESVYEGKV